MDAHSFDTLDANPDPHRDFGLDPGPDPHRDFFGPDPDPDPHEMDADPKVKSVLNKKFLHLRNVLQLKFDKIKILSFA
jgi:hypothetical protein